MIKTIGPANDQDGTASIKYVLVKDTNQASSDQAVARWVFPTSADQLKVDQDNSQVWTDPNTGRSEVLVRFQG